MVLVIVGMVVVVKVGIRCVRSILMVIFRFLFMMVVTVWLNLSTDWRIRNILMGTIKDLSVDVVVGSCAVWEQDVERPKGTYTGQGYVKLAMCEDRLGKVNSNTIKCTSL